MNLTRASWLSRGGLRRRSRHRGHRTAARGDCRLHARAGGRRTRRLRRQLRRVSPARPRRPQRGAAAGRRQFHEHVARAHDGGPGDANRRDDAARQRRGRSARRWPPTSRRSSCRPTARVPGTQRLTPTTAARIGDIGMRQTPPALAGAPAAPAAAPAPLPRAAQPARPHASPAKCRTTCRSPTRCCATSRPATG